MSFARSARLLSAAIVGLVAVVISGCRSASPLAAQSELAAGNEAWRDRDVLTAAEVSRRLGATPGTAFQALRRLRPEFLQTTIVKGGLPTAARPSLFVNGAQVDGLETLGTIDAAWIVDVRLVRPADAMRRYGADFANGIILLTMRGR